MKNYLLLFSLAMLFFVQVKSIAQSPSGIKLKDYRPKSIYKIPITKISKAKFPVIDMHSHTYATHDADLAQWVKTMDASGIEKTIIMTQFTGYKFDSVYAKYSKYGDRFEVWCGFDYTGYPNPGWVNHAVQELERCFKVGAKGVGELGDKGLGEVNSEPTPGYGLHVDDVLLKPLFEKCAALRMPVNIHVAEPYWMYQPMDSTNDGLMNAYAWQVDLTKQGILNHAQLIKTLENVVSNNPKTTFIACHLANCEYDLEILGAMFRKYSNLYADLGARFGETAPIPRYMNAFCERYQDRLLYGTDMGFDPAMYATTFRILETTDEHFYEIELFGYHWPLYGFGLKDSVLKKIYSGNARKILHP
ncbi:MAG: amidohydrolase family protein [Cyclobacteriaceae bacterium]|nr:amidohydrolase family protein [Cyclobacteriaceae bacterium]